MLPFFVCLLFFSGRSTWNLLLEGLIDEVMVVVAAPDNPDNPEYGVENVDTG